MGIKEITKGFFDKSDQLISQMSQAEIEKYAKGASRDYALFCAIGGHLVYRTTDKTLRCAHCGVGFTIQEGVLVEKSRE